MTVAELIINLASMPQDSEVAIEAKYDFCPVKSFLMLKLSKRVLLVPGTDEDEEEIRRVS